MAESSFRMIHLQLDLVVKTMPLFDVSLHSEFDRPNVVIRHELGHAVTWFHFGEAIGRLKCCRRADGQLLPRVALWPRANNIEKLKSPEYAEPLVERLLAGEISARRTLKMRTDQICSRNLPVTGDSNHLAYVLNQIDDNDDLAKEDIVKVLTLALNNAQQDWRAWITERMIRANELVDQNWTAIDQIALKLEARLPAAGKSRIWTGGELIARMSRYGVHSRKNPAVEIVYNDNHGGLLTRMKRFLQEMGPRGIICRYEDDPGEE
jgi:hypothetical protein